MTRIISFRYLCHQCGEVWAPEELKRSYPRKYHGYNGNPRVSFKCPKCRNRVGSLQYPNVMEIWEGGNMRPGRSFLQLVRVRGNYVPTAKDIITQVSALVRSDMELGREFIVPAILFMSSLLKKDWKPGSGPIKDLKNDPTLKKVFEVYKC